MEKNPSLPILLSSLLVFCLTTPDLRAESATWTGEVSNYWFSSGNWNPETVPDGPTDVATFSASAQTDVTISSTIEESGLIFEQGADSFNFTQTYGRFSLLDAGMSNNSGVVQSFDCLSVCFSCQGGSPNSMEFFNNATAGNLTSFALEGAYGSEAFGGELYFWDSATAGSATIDNFGTDYSYSGTTYFYDNSSADHAVIVNHGSTNAYASGATLLDDEATAGDATIINEGALNRKGDGGILFFRGDSTSGDSTITCNGDTVGSERPSAVYFQGAFGGGSSYGASRVILHGNGSMHVEGGFYELEVTVGSIEGDGAIFVGDIAASELIVGTNNRSSTFRGVIEDKASSAGGSFTKVGTGTLTLTGANSYSGGTTIESGSLRISNLSGSGTGPGEVVVNGGTLSGRGTISGQVTVGTDGLEGTLDPGDEKPGTLTMQSDVLFNTHGTYICTIDTERAQADQMVANGVTIKRGAKFAISPLGARRLRPGTVFMVIKNTLAGAGRGTFGNLHDAALITVGPNTFQADYQGGDGNDLTLTVVR